MNDLITLISEKLSLSPADTQKALGLVSGFLKNQLASGDYSKLLSALPGLEALTLTPNPATANTGLMGFASSALSALGVTKAAGLTQLASSLSAANVDISKASELLPLISGYLESKGQGQLVDVLKKALS